MLNFPKILKFIQIYKWYVLTALLIFITSLFMLSSCAPFQLNLPGSCAIFSQPEKVTQNQDQATVQNKKKGLFEK